MPAQTLIRSLLRRNPQHRPTARALLKHPWIRSPQAHGRHPSLDLTMPGTLQSQPASCFAHGAGLAADQPARTPGSRLDPQQPLLLASCI